MVKLYVSALLLLFLQSTFSADGDIKFISAKPDIASYRFSLSGNIFKLELGKQSTIKKLSKCHRKVFKKLMNDIYSKRSSYNCREVGSIHMSRLGSFKSKWCSNLHNPSYYSKKINNCK